MISTLREKFSELACIIASLSNEDDVYNFLRDLMTEEEIFECIHRWEISKLLSRWVSYVQIKKITGANSTTIARVQKYLKGKNQWYQKALQYIDQSDNAPEKTQNVENRNIWKWKIK